jgi:hypothetical protein
MSLSTIFGTPPTAPTTPDSPGTPPTAPSTPEPSDLCESTKLLDTNKNIITAINELITSYNSCHEDTCKLIACDQKFRDLVQALEENYKKKGFISNNIKKLVVNDFTFNDTDSDIYVFELVLKFLKNHFLTQLKNKKIEYLNLLKNILNPETKGGRRKSKKNKSKKNKSKKNKSRKNRTKTRMTQK